MSGERAGDGSEKGCILTGDEERGVDFDEVFAGDRFGLIISHSVSVASSSSANSFASFS